MDADFRRLFEPRSVAIVGATEAAGKPGRVVLEQLRLPGVRLFPVNPTRATVLGLPAWASVSELPEVPDLAVIALGARAAVPAAEECAAHGIRFVVVLASGFAEAGDDGRALQLRLAALNERHGTRVLGPNTLGLQIPGGADTVFVDHATDDLDRGGIALISQSGSVAVEAVRHVAPAGFPLRAFVGLGNECDLSAAEFVNHFADDDQTSCICLYLEHLGGGRAFLREAARAASRKPVLMLKAGRTTGGAAAVSSHTGRLAGSDRVVDGALRQHGIQRMVDDEDLCDSARVLTLSPLPAGNRVAVVSPAGGYGVMCADCIGDDHDVRLELAVLGASTTSAIRAISLPFASARNPVDLTAGVDDAGFGEALRVVLEDDGVDVVVPIALFAPQGITDGLVAEIAAAKAASGKPVVVFCQDGRRTTERLGQLYRNGVPAFSSIARTVRAVRTLVARRRLEEARG